MIDVSRRRLLSFAATASAACAVPGWASAATRPRTSAKKSVMGDELCLIFAGSWLFVFEDGAHGKQIRAITPAFQEHAYHYGESSAQKLGRANLLQGANYTVQVDNLHAPTASARALVQPLIASGSGFVYSNAVSLRKDLDPTQLRTVIIPMPDFMDPAGTVTTTITKFDRGTVMQGTAVGANGLAHMPAATVFRYSSATGAIAHGGSSDVKIGAHQHLQFRTLPKKFDVESLPCAACDPNDLSGAEHENMAFAAMMDLLSFPAGMAKPTISVPLSCHGAKTPAVPGISPIEYGFVPECNPPAGPLDPSAPLRGAGLGACGNNGGVVNGGCCSRGATKLSLALRGYAVQSEQIP